MRLFYAKRSFDESKHPRASKGNSNGGQFVSNGNRQASEPSNFADLQWAHQVLNEGAKRQSTTFSDAPKQRRVVPPAKVEHNSGQAFFSIPPEPVATKPSRPQKSALEIQQQIVNRQNGVDALTRRREAAQEERGAIIRNRLFGYGPLTDQERTRIKHLEASVSYCDGLIQQFRSEIAAHQQQLRPGQRVPDLPPLKKNGPRQIDGGTPGKSQLLDAVVMSELATASYDKEELSESMKQSGWKPKRLYHDYKDGFHAVLFENAKTGEYVLGFAGTEPDSFWDIWADIVQGLGLPTSQYKKAIDLAAKLKQDYPNLRLTGHSLGVASHRQPQS